MLSWVVTKAFLACFRFCFITAVQHILADPFIVGEFLLCPSSSDSNCPLWQARARSSCADGGGRCPRGGGCYRKLCVTPSYCPAMHWQQHTLPCHALAYTGIHCPAMHWQQHTHNALGDQLLTKKCALVSNGLKVAVAVMEKLAPETYHKKACAKLSIWRQWQCS